MDRVTNRKSALKETQLTNKHIPPLPPAAMPTEHERHSLPVAYPHSHEPSSPLRASYARYSHRHYSPYTPPRSLYRPRHVQLSSSPEIQFTPADDPTLFPHIGTWLDSLREGPRGADGDDFTQFGPALVEQGFKRVFHLARPEFTVEELRRICGYEITEGLALTLLDYAKRDTQKIISEETRRRRKQRSEPRRYI